MQLKTLSLFSPTQGAFIQKYPSVSLAEYGHTPSFTIPDGYCFPMSVYFFLQHQGHVLVEFQVKAVFDFHNQHKAGHSIYIDPAITKNYGLSEVHSNQHFDLSFLLASIEQKKGALIFFFCKDPDTSEIVGHCFPLIFKRDAYYLYSHNMHENGHGFAHHSSVDLAINHVVEVAQERAQGGDVFYKTVQLVSST